MDKDENDTFRQKVIPEYRQLRLRHLKQIIGINFQKLLGVKDSEAYFYTIHKITDGISIYESEKCFSHNPLWKQITKTLSNGNAEGIIVKLWCWTDQEIKLLGNYGIYFSGLSLWPRELELDPGLFKKDILVFLLKEDKYIIRGSSLEPIKMLDHVVCSDGLEDSYNLETAKRLRTVGRGCHARKQKIDSIKLKLDAIFKKLKTDCGYINGTISELQVRMFIMKDLISKSENTIEVHKSNLQKLISENQAKSEKLSSEKEDLSQNHDKLTRAAYKMNFNLRNYISISKKSDIRQRDLLSQMLRIYPIHFDRAGKYYIRKLHLPVTDKLKGTDETETSVALGYICHLILWLVTLIRFPLSYPINYQSSRSTIRDDISINLETQYRLVPLYMRGSMELLTDYGLYLLNKNVAQLRWYCGLETLSLKSTIPNLMELLNFCLQGLDIKLLELPYMTEFVTDGYQISSDVDCEEFFVLNHLPPCDSSIYTLSDSQKVGSAFSLNEDYEGESQEKETSVKEQVIEDSQVSHNNNKNETTNIPYASEALDICDSPQMFGLDFQLRADVLASQSRTFKLAKIKAEQ